ncbi:cadmium-translocating P-type ATPase [Clostridium sp. MCC344]|nr:heavy metal translocating P-type ATPase [Clostridium sp. MCC344]MBT9789331.1 cadmium-translocating P-type ATPase [Clostridium sp. MCC344]
MDELERTKQEPDEHEAEECCCGHHHHHDEDHCCGHEHGEHHDAHHDEHHEHKHCGCGHHHHHDGEDHCCDDDDDDDCCGHEHGEHHEGHEEHHHASTPKSECIVYVMKNIDCANCSAKIEKKIQELPEVDDCILTFATRQLRVYSSEGTKLLPKMQAIADQIEPGTIIEVRPKNPKAVCTVYVMKNIDCANCSAKIEKKIQELPEVDDCILTFATRQLRVYSSEGTKLLPKMQEIADQIEPGTVIEIREEGKPSSDTHDDKHDHDIPELLAGAALFIIGELLSHSMPPVSIGCFVIAYLILGREVLLTALKNMKSGHVMDENFLMSVATIGAFAIGEFGEAVGVMLFYRVGEAFEHRAVEKSRSQIMEAVDLRPETVLLDENGTVREIPAGSAAVGNIVQIRPGDRIPLDGVVVEGESRIDTSPITGEPVPVSVTVGSTLTSGCVNTSGLLKMRVEKELSESMVTRILDSVENAAASKPQAERFITKFARVYTPFVVALAAATAIIPSLITGNWSHWIYTALTFLVISCPCALVLSVPLAFFSGIGAGSRKGILFKGGIALETLKNVKTVVMDKTGTITKGNFIVQDIVPSANYTAAEVLQAAAACETASTHPIGTSILLAAKEQDLSLENPAQLEEISGKGIHARLSCGDVLCGNRKLLTEFNVDCGTYDENGAVTTVYVAINGTFAGTIQISDTIKPEAKDAIRTLKSMGIRSAMLTGDGEAAAEAVADAVGIDHVYAKLLPADKLEILQKLRAESGSAMFVGDGINDAPVLAGADVGAAMGSGADAAIEAADVVFMTSSMDAIPTAIRIAKSTGAISNQNVVFALAVKALVMVLGLMGIASMWLAVFADTGVAILCVLNSIRILYKK